MITRFAPAPTGYLHLGHVLNAIYVWGVARANGGRVLLRIEDHDRQRSRPEFERAIREDLDWLGFAADGEVPRQSDRAGAYAGALARLRARGLVYACGCSRAQVASAASDAGSGSGSPRPTAAGLGQLPDLELRYPGTCRTKSIAERPDVGIRIRLDPSVERFDDLRRGPQEQRPSEQCGDLLARDRDGNWTYQFAVTVDDMEQEVTHVIRGEDLLASTGRQIQLARLLGRARPPLFLHHALIMKSATQKLSKADRDTSVRELRASGRSAAAVIGEAAKLGGLLDCSRLVAAHDAAALVGDSGRSFA